MKWKRRLDWTVILLSLPVTLPVSLLIAAYIKVVSPGPVLFVQKRVGFGGRTFSCFKFRSMHPNADQGLHRAHSSAFLSQNAPMTKLDQNDPRVIPFGRILRATGLDELPQFLNVLRGEMSIVGPRPCTPYELESYLPWQKERFRAVPGITGLWQVSGKNRTTFVEMIRHDIDYAQRASLKLDLWIMSRTPAVVIGAAWEALRNMRNKFGARAVGARACA